VRGAIEIGHFTAGQQPALHISRTVVSAASAICSLLFHLALIAPAIWNGAHQRPPIRPQPGNEAAHEHDRDEIALQLVSISDDSMGNPPAPPPVISAPRIAPVPVAAEILEFAVNFLADTPEIAAQSAADDAQSSSQLQGQYVGQMAARIDRAWLRPRSPIGDVRFLCEVRIEQDSGGNIKEVTLESCNGTSRWQLSLVRAIESASPLPAPPDPSVFAHSIHISFQAVPIELAQSGDQYEVEMDRAERTGRTPIYSIDPKRAN